MGKPCSGAVELGSVLIGFFPHGQITILHFPVFIHFHSQLANLYLGWIVCIVKSFAL